MTFYTGDLFPEWKGNLFITTLAPRIGRKLIRIVLEETRAGETPQGVRVAGEEWLMTELGESASERRSKAPKERYTR